MPRMLAGGLIAAAVMAGMYVIALAIAANMTPTFNLAETANHARVLEFANAARLVSTAPRTAGAKCELLVGSEKKICNAEAAAELRRAKTRARGTYKDGTLFHDGINLTVETAANDLRAPPEIDVALYRAHRQLH